MSEYEALTIRDAQEHLKVSRPTVYHLIATGQLKTCKVGRRRFTTTAYLNAFIERSTAKATGG